MRLWDSPFENGIPETTKKEAGTTICVKETGGCFSPPAFGFGYHSARSRVVEIRAPCISATGDCRARGVSEKMSLSKNAKSYVRKLGRRVKRRVKRVILSQAKKHLSDEGYVKCKRHDFEGTFCKPKPKPGSYTPSTTYSIVIAVYNVAPYLDDFFESLTAQTMELSALQIVVADDGSTDGSADVVESWQKRFPEIIEYHRKENGGQASARNFGLGFARGEWVTFIDPDDFVAPCYFEEVDRAIREHHDLQMVSCRLVFFRETSCSFSDSHPLTYRFKEEESLYNVDDGHMPIQLSMATAFFRCEAIEAASLRVDEGIVPNFEDGHFVGRYLLSLAKGRVAYLRRPVYYYRKRTAGGSTLDNSWKNDARLAVVPQKGYLALLEHAQAAKGRVPRRVQNTVLYDISWYFKYFDNRGNRAQRFLTSGAAARFWELAAKIFKYIDNDTIAEAPGAWIDFNRKAALLRTFKGEEPPYCIFYVRHIDFERGFMLLSSVDPRLEISCNGRIVKPFLRKECPVFTLGRHFYSDWLLSYPLPGPDDTISYQMGSNVPATLSLGKKRFAHSVSSSDLFRFYKKGWESYEQHGDLWMFMDRDTQADDNAEHLYRWVAQHHPEREIAFALRRESPDWDRLEAEGFNMLTFGSKEHERELRRCSAIISAHVDDYVYSYFKDNFHRSKKYVFLQHGITKDDISSWINGKPIDLMLTSSQAEFDSIAGDKSPYLLTGLQTALTGFPRHDALLEKARMQEGDIILVMPTWRKELCGRRKGWGNARMLGDSFADSRYRGAWEAFLSDARLREIAEAAGKRIVFFPHTNMFPYIEAGMFEVPGYVEVAGNQTGCSIQDAFARASLFVTDFSSTAFEAAYIECPCVYYQFDGKAYWENQEYVPGYFDYERDGFGPVVETLDEAIAAVEKIAGRDFEPAAEYLDRMRGFFSFHDGKCCERAYDAIESLFKPL